MLNILCGNVFSLFGFKNIGGVVFVNCKVYIMDFIVLYFKILCLLFIDKNYVILFI